MALVRQIPIPHTSSLAIKAATDSRHDVSQDSLTLTHQHAFAFLIHQFFLFGSPIHITFSHRKSDEKPALPGLSIT